MSSGYRTISTDALTVITGIAPIKERIQIENIKTRALGLRDSSVKNEWLGSMPLQSKVPRWLLHPAKQTCESQVQASLAQHDLPQTSLAVYTDGSKTNSEVAASYCVMDGPNVIHV